jgi:hypothetical protein
VRYHPRYLERPLKGKRSLGTRLARAVLG